MGQQVYLRTGEVAELLGVNPRTIRRWIALRQIRCFTTPGGENRVPKSEVERILRQPLPSPEAL
ncbi:MAG: helix-turn-helix domain-containing protein [Chloroflexi bacterium]|nr:helix-turn-helix domain-containing protein [Chloroflexota bacterium]MCH8350862.1 helix-turn-helix domain-containing protein [Chloroflexota bacterium]MCI0780806.1 helix-turn-helix domain-containing protein [Chloroflexota bacterium]